MVPFTIEVESLFVILLGRRLVLLLELRAAFVAWRTMCLPINEADPAELVFALSAGHVVASLILLDVDLTVWALLGVLGDVLHTQSLRHDASSPLYYLIAAQWSVAERMAAQTDPTSTHLLTLQELQPHRRHSDVQLAVQTALKAIFHALGISHSKLLFVAAHDCWVHPTIGYHTAALTVGTSNQELVLLHFSLHILLETQRTNAIAARYHLCSLGLLTDQAVALVCGQLLPKEVPSV